MGEPRSLGAGDGALHLAIPGIDGSASERLTDILDRICDLVSKLMHAPTVILARRDPKSDSIKVVGKTGTLLTEVDMSFIIPSLDSKRCPIVVCDDVRRDARFFQHPLLQLMPHIRSIIVMLVPGSDAASRVVLKVINPSRGAMNDGKLMSMLSGIGHIVARLLSGDAEPADEDGGGGVKRIGETAPADSADEAAASRFLLDSLVTKHSLRVMGGASCTALRAWRTPIRRYQVSALDALKKRVPPDFLSKVAAEITAYARSMHGERVIAYVASPSGPSGRVHHAANEALAKLVAEALGARYVVPPLHQEMTPGLAEACGGRGKGPLLLTAVESLSPAQWQQGVSSWRKEYSPIYGVSWIG